MPRANAALAPRQRLRIAKLVVDDGRAIAHAAVYFHVSWPSAAAQAILARDRLNQRSHVDRRTGEPARRYEHE